MHLTSHTRTHSHTHTHSQHILCMGLYVQNSVFSRLPEGLIELDISQCSDLTDDLVCAFVCCMCLGVCAFVCLSTRHLAMFWYVCSCVFVCGLCTCVCIFVCLFVLCVGSCGCVWVMFVCVFVSYRRLAIL